MIFYLLLISWWQKFDQDVPKPIIVIDQDSDSDATIVQLSFGDRLGALLDTVNEYANSILYFESMLLMILTKNEKKQKKCMFIIFAIFFVLYTSNVHKLWSLRVIFMRTNWMVGVLHAPYLSCLKEDQNGSFAFHYRRGISPTHFSSSKWPRNGLSEGKLLQSPELIMHGESIFPLGVFFHCGCTNPSYETD